MSLAAAGEVASEIAKAGSFVSRLDKKKVLAVRTVAEGVSIASATVGSVLVGDVLLRGPYETTKEWVGKYVVLPYLPYFEQWLEKVPSIDTPSERRARVHMPPEQRAQLIGNKVMDIFGLPMVMSWAGQFAAQSYGIKALGLDRKISKWENRLAFAGDKLVVAGAIGVLNYGIPETSEKMQKSLENNFRRMGLSEQSSQSLAGSLVNWQLPNLLGLAASLGILNWALRR